MRGSLVSTLCSFTVSFPSGTGWWGGSNHMLSSPCPRRSGDSGPLANLGVGMAVGVAHGQFCGLVASARLRTPSGQACNSRALLVVPTHKQKFEDSVSWVIVSRDSTTGTLLRRLRQHLTCQGLSQTPSFASPGIRPGIFRGVWLAKLLWYLAIA